MKEEEGAVVEDGWRERAKAGSFFRDVIRPQSVFYERIKAEAREAGLSMKAVANIWLADAWAMRSPATEELVAVMKGRPAGGWFSAESLARMRAKERRLEAENRRLKQENEILKGREEAGLFKVIGLFPEGGSAEEE